MVQVNVNTLLPDAPLLEAIKLIELSHKRIAIVLDAEGRLAGTLTDGDVRRALLAGGTLETKVADAMNPSPLTAFADSSETYLLDLMRARNVLAIPIVDERNVYKGLVHLTDLVSDEEHDDARRYEFAVIMCGGEGKRLRPITENLPRPMVDIGGVPLLERQIVRLRDAGVREIYLSVNFLSHVIEDYFGDGERLNIKLKYLREEEKLGTAGALSLLPRSPQRPILVMNGDVLTSSNLGSLLDFHLAHAAVITAAAIDYRIDIPYGVFRTDGSWIRGVSEKPSQRFLCNAGIYAVSPPALKYLPAHGSFDMTDLLDRCLAEGERIAVFPVHEYWSDIATPADLEAARGLLAETAR